MIKHLKALNSLENLQIRSDKSLIFSKIKHSQSPYRFTDEAFLSLGKTLKPFKSLQTLEINAPGEIRSQKVTDKAVESLQKGLSTLTSLKRLSLTFSA